MYKQKKFFNIKEILMNKSIGGAFLVLGTTIGSGMLSLPLITAICGPIISIVLIVISWSIMYVTSLKLINICANEPLGINYPTLIEKKMPLSLQIIFIFFYLLLLYSLMAAYTTQGSSFVGLISSTYSMSTSINTTIFIISFGFIIFSVKFSDYINRYFVSIKLLFYLLCIANMALWVNISNIFNMPLSFHAILFAWPTLLPSFGFQNIIPVLYEYQKGNLEIIKNSIIIGSVIVLFVYIIWIFICLTILPQKGIHSYASIFKEGNSITEFSKEIKNITKNTTINTFLSIFINISVITSFICVGLSLFHYIKNTGKRFGYSINRFKGFVITFLPPFIFTVFYPKGFILALKYAAIFAVVIFVFIPIYLDKKNRKNFSSVYCLLLGILVIITQIFNLIMN